jgi:hypothetical protein
MPKRPKNVLNTVWITTHNFLTLFGHDFNELRLFSVLVQVVINLGQ